MRTKLRVAALLVVLMVIAWWFFAGHRLDFNQDTAIHFVKDPVTGIEGPVEEKQFIPGYEFLAEGLGIAVLLGVVSFFFKRKTVPKPG
jgi:hypothetical protein